MKLHGVDIQVEGKGSETLVMLHGWPDTLALWNDTVQALSDTHQCVRFTLPAFDAHAPMQAKSLVQMVSFIDEVVCAVSPQKPVTLVLHDWGCVFGYEYAAQHPGCGFFDCICRRWKNANSSDAKIWPSFWASFWPSFWAKFPP